jgi:hypothetical protein
MDFKNEFIIELMECILSGADELHVKHMLDKETQNLQLQQTGVSGCFSKEEVVNIILEFTNIALHSNSHNLSRTELRELLRVAKNGWLNNR